MVCWVLDVVQGAIVRVSDFIRRSQIELCSLSPVGLDRGCFLGCNILLLRSRSGHFVSLDRFAYSLVLTCVVCVETEEEQLHSFRARED